MHSVLVQVTFCIHAFKFIFPCRTNNIRSQPISVKQLQIQQMQSKHKNIKRTRRSYETQQQRLRLSCRLGGQQLEKEKKRVAAPCGLHQQYQQQQQEQTAFTSVAPSRINGQDNQRQKRINKIKINKSNRGIN